MHDLRPGYILLVEDNPDDEALTKRAFKKNNIANVLHVVRDGQEAIDFIDGKTVPDNITTLGPPEFILLDLQLPKIEGMDVLRHIRSHDTTRTIPVVVLTTSDEQRDIINSYGLGANSFVRKPVDFKEFLEVVGRMGLYWLIHNQPCPSR